MSEHWLTISQACDAFQVSRRTLQRRLSAGDIEGAKRDGQGRWLVTVSALHAAQIPARQTWKDDATDSAPNSENSAPRRDNTRQTQSKTDDTGATQSTPTVPDVATLRAKLRDIERELETEKQLRAAAERNADDLRLAMRMLEPSTPKPGTPTPEVSPRRRWWKRG